jgi:hypothetical protein
MFKKLVSNLPFNPSLISHLRDYDLRLKRDLKLRITGVIILLLVLVIQIVAILLPPRNSTAYSPNNLITNSSNSINQLLNDCLINQNNYQNILSFYNINCNQIDSGKSTKLILNSSSNALYSLNRLSYDPQNETSITISGQKFYIRSILFGNKLQSKSLPVLELNLNSQTYYINLGSGSIIGSKDTLINNQKTQFCANPQTSSCLSYSLAVRVINSSNIDANDTTVSAGSSLVYTLSATNESSHKIANQTIDINLQNALAYSNITDTYGGVNQSGVVSYKLSSVLPGQTQTEIITTQVKSPIPSSSISINDPNYLAQKMITSFGNSVVIFVPKTINKFYEISINNYLPSTSSKDSLIILVVILLITIYLLLRTMVIRQEIKIIRHNHSNHEEKSKK